MWCKTSKSLALDPCQPRSCLAIHFCNNNGDKSDGLIFHWNRSSGWDGECGSANLVRLRTGFFVRLYYLGARSFRELKLLAQGRHRCALWECFSSRISVIILTASCFSRHSISSMPFFVSCILITSAPHSCHGSKFEWCSNGLINTLYNDTT